MSIRYRNKEESLMQKYGYVRVSTLDQNEDRQLVAMEKIHL